MLWTNLLHPMHADKPQASPSRNLKRSTFNEASSISNQIEAVLSYLPRDGSPKMMMQHEFLDSSSKSSLLVKARAAAADYVRPWVKRVMDNVASGGRLPTQNLSD